MRDLSNENVIHIKKDGVQFLQFKRLLEFSDIIKHAYSLGIERNFRTSSANLKDVESSLNNYKDLCSAIGTDYKHIIKSNQKHTKEVKCVDKLPNLGFPNINLEKYKNTDGLITNKKDIILTTTNADCILLLFFDPIKRVIANTHSGWRGTLQRISVNTVRKMKKEYGCKCEDIICCICPSIRKCHFEVERDVKELFEKEFLDIKDIMSETIANKKWNIDNVLINKIILEEEGLKRNNIIDSGICSVCNCDLIHSFRKEGAGYGLSTALIELNSK